MLNDLPKGFQAAAVEANFKKAGRKDLGLIFSDRPAVAAGLFTTNIFCAAPVQICRKIISTGLPVQAIVGNSGNANACTGEEGLRNCEEIQTIVATMLHIRPDEVLPISTGVIGQQFDMEKWRKALPTLQPGTADALGFTQAIMTTDAFPKYQSRDIEMSNGSVRLTVMAKGAGMICPNMATMLCVCLADAMMERKQWQEIFKKAVANTFNRVSVDGDTSTNDTILGLANGASGVAAANAADMAKFETALTEILGDVAYLLVKDGEGAKHVLVIKITGAPSLEAAEKIARSVGNSQLVKTAIYGGDANWGRIINAVGYAGIPLDGNKVTLKLCGIERFHDGRPVNEDCEAELAKRLEARDIDIEIALGAGDAQYKLLASDLGHEYVSLNSDYRS